jgi:Domain of unknown function (DUF4145)
VSKNNFPQVACPVCLVGHLVPEKLQGTPTAAAKQVYEQTGNPIELSGVFTGTLRCAIHTCREPVAVAGAYTVDPDADETGNSGWGDMYKVRYMEPPPRIIVTPKGTPEAVVKALDSASRVLWADPSSAANRMRVAIENLMTEYGMRRYGVRNHKRYRLSTQARIVEFRKYESTVAETLEAVKWIGNAGSHETEMTADDVLEGAELLSYALNLLYDDSEEQLQRRVRAVNRRKGLARKRAKK